MLNQDTVKVNNQNTISVLKNDLAVVVILYNPDNEVYLNIKTYLDYIDKLYVIDNSEKVNDKLVYLLKQQHQVEYLKNSGNMGIAYSLNRILQMVQKKYAWLMTMDQDTSFIKNTFLDYAKNIYNLYEFDGKIYGICPNMNQKELHSNVLIPIKHCITSGNIINIEIALKCGGFDENLFIDEVDKEFCYRCNEHGYILLQYYKSILHHKIGNPIFIKFLNMNFVSANESYFRMYYIIRNHLYVANKYPTVRNIYYFDILRWIVKIILFEPDKIRKIKYSYIGFKDYLRNKMGKY